MSRWRRRSQSYLIGIESTELPSSASLRPPLNRTLLELKVDSPDEVIRHGLSQSYLIGIESRSPARRYKSHRPLNRTLLELKDHSPESDDAVAAGSQSYLIGIERMRKFIFASGKNSPLNRTLLELKERPDK